MVCYNEIASIQPKKILHCGAHTCDEFDEYERLGAELVVWVEANPNQIPICQAKLQNKPNHILINKAIYNKDDELVEFNICNQVWASSLFEFGEDINKYWSPHYHTNKVQVPSITIDTLLQQLNIAPSEIDLLCLDIQGAEVLALQGAQQLLRHVKNMYIEVIWADAYKDGCRKDDVENIIFPLGFRETYRMTHADNHQADILYRR